MVFLIFYKFLQAVTALQIKKGEMQHHTSPKNIIFFTLPDVRRYSKLPNKNCQEKLR